MPSISKSTAKARLGDVPEEKRFWCHDGRHLKSLEELELALEEMTEETFRHHSNESKTDFSNWIKDVIGDEKLARDLIIVAGPGQAAGIVAARIDWLKKRAGLT
jgi:hypothetical protein